MPSNPVAEVIAEIAERERTLAVKEGNYAWAFICALVEFRAREASDAH